MPRRGHSTTIGKIAKFYRDRQASEIRMLGESLRREQLIRYGQQARQPQTREDSHTP